VTLTAKLMNVEEDIEAVKVAADNKALQRKSLTGRWPVLEAPDGTLISESLPIAKYLARQHPTFYGQTEAQRAQVEMWIDFINSSVAPAAKRVIDQVVGKAPSDVKSFSIALNELKATLTSVEQHLRLRNFLVGHQLTLADALLVSTVSECFELVLDKKGRDGTLPNLARYTTLILRMPPFKRVFGAVIFCKDVIQPVFEERSQQQMKPTKTPQKGK